MRENIQTRELLFITFKNEFTLCLGSLPITSLLSQLTHFNLVTQAQLLTAVPFGQSYVATMQSVIHDHFNFQFKISIAAFLSY